MPDHPNEVPESVESVVGPIPGRVPVMPIKGMVLFPTGATGLQVGFPPNVEVLTTHRERNLVVALVHTDDDEMPINPASIEKVGLLARVLNRLNLPGGTIQTTMQGLIRVRLEDVRLEGGYYSGRTRLVEETTLSDADAKRLIELILTTLGGIGAHVERLADVPRILRSNMGDPGRFADLAATLAHLDAEECDAVLQRLDVEKRLEYVLERLEAMWERIRTRTSQEEVGPKRVSSDEESGDRRARLRKRIASLQAELGELDPAEREAIEMIRRIEGTQLPVNVAAAARREAERLRTTSPTSVDAAEIRDYLELLLSLPWSKVGSQRSIDLDRVRNELDRCHLGLEEVKQRVLEFLAVARLKRDVAGPIPCIVGPPNVGKRSLAAAVARGLGRPMARIELEGRGEEQLVGTRRIRRGASPGKLLEAYRETGVQDPVILFEEIDLVGLGKVEGDPVEALEEVMDPEARVDFVDRYLDLRLDLSETIFIATANDFYRIPRNLREFLIEIRIAGYTPEEKVAIARERLLPRLIEEHGLDPDEITTSDETLLFLTRGYARDAGLGNLRRGLGAVLRYIAHEKALRPNPDGWKVTRELIEEILGTPRYPSTEAESAPETGVVTGLAWTASGGELMFIEALKMPGTGRLIITGMLGEVMRESVNAAYSYVRSRADMLGIPDELFPDHDLHIHFPVGATPKDGPSAGAAVTLAIASSLADRRVRHDVAMTGEVTLRGKILEIGGVKEKVLAAYRAGLRRVILPVGNERDLRDVPADVREGMTFHFVRHMDEVFGIALTDVREAPERGGRRRVSTDRERRSAQGSSTPDSKIP